MTEFAIRAVDSRSEGDFAVRILNDHGKITISDGELTDQTTNHLCFDVENAGKLGKVLVALAASLETDPTGTGTSRRLSAAMTRAHSSGLWQRGQH